MAHEAETQSPAIIPAPAASTRRKRLILLCCEDLRPVACALEDALRSRGWEVDLELGADAKPWVQKVPPVRPSLRVLCVPGTVDPALAQQLRTAFMPEPDADLHILGVDDSPGLVQAIERLAGVVPPRPRSLYAAPRLAHPTRVETQVRSERRWLVGATSVLAAFAITLGGIAMVQHSTRAPKLSMLPAASLAAPITTPIRASMPVLDEDRPAITLDHGRDVEPVLAAAAPGLPAAWEDEPAPPEEEDELVLLEDEPEPEPALAARHHVDVTAPPLAEPSSVLPITPPVAEIPVEPPITTTVPTLPSGFLPVAGLPVSDAAPVAPTRHLPEGFLPVAGMTAAPPVTTVDPFSAPAIPALGPDASTPITTVDPFASSVESVSP